MNEKIVLVEDNRPIREMVCYILEQSGYRVVSAVDGKTAITAIHNEHPDLVLLDLDLPGSQSGFDVVELLRADADTWNTTLVAFTAFAMVGERQRVMRAGFDGYITKPIDPETFVKDVASYLRPAA